MAVSDWVLYHVCPAPFPLPTLPTSGLPQAGPAPALTGGLWALPTDSLAAFHQHTALHGPLASADLGLAPAPSPGVDRKALAEATNGESRGGPQNGGRGDPPAAPRSIKVEAAEEPEAEPGPLAPSRTPSPPSPGPARVKAELSSPTPGSSPGPSALFLPHLPAAPPASEILAKMSELVHSRLQAGTGLGAPTGLFAGAP